MGERTAHSFYRPLDGYLVWVTDYQQAGGVDVGMAENGPLGEDFGIAQRLCTVILLKRYRRRI